MEHAGFLADQQPADRSVCLAQARRPAAGDALDAALDDVLVGVGEIHFDIGLDLAPGGRGPGVEQQPARPRINVERLGPRMPDRVVERNSRQQPGAAHPAGAGAGIAALAVERSAQARPVQIPHDLCPGDAADAQRSREAAGGDRCRGRPGLRPEPRHKRRGSARRRRLRELVDPFLEELLIGPQIRQLIGVRRAKASQQRNRGAQPADRRHAADIPLLGHRDPPDKLTFVFA